MYSINNLIHNKQYFSLIAVLIIFLSSNTFGKSRAYQPADKYTISRPHFSSTQPLSHKTNYSSQHQRVVGHVMHRIDGDTSHRHYQTPATSYTIPQLQLVDDAHVDVVLSDSANDENIKYLYQIQGVVDTAWHRLPDSRTLNLQGLPSGNYKINIRPSYSAGFTRGNVLTIGLEKHRTWWKSLWLKYVFALLVLSLLIYYFIHIRRQQHRRFQQLQSQLADDLHDELGALLVRASFQAETLKYEQPMALSAANQLLVNLQEASQAMRDIAWGISPSSNTLGNMLDRMQEYIGQLPSTTLCHIKIIHANVPVEKKLDTTVRQHIYYIFKEAVTNALRHARNCRTLIISLNQQSNQLVLQIENDGAFVVSTHLGMGLRSMHRRAQAIGGHLIVAPCPSGGFKVILTVTL